MLVDYQMTIYSEKKMVDCIKFKCYDDFSATHKAQRFFKVGSFDTVRLTKNGKGIKTFKRKR